MIYPGKVAGIAVGLLALAAWGWMQLEREAPVVNSTSRASAPDSTQHLPSERGPLGVASCAAAACHGNPFTSLPSTSNVDLASERPADCWKSSYLTWATFDKHARAYEVLKNERSARIMQKLASTTNAWEDARCLACHANPSLAKRDDAAAKLLRHEGVGCESCHGNAAGWLTSHTGWTPSTDRQRVYHDAHMAKLFDPGVRAEVCADCHIGAPATADTPARDVGHDLIAAGHPRLNFEFTTYLRLLPRHWAEKDRLKEGGRRDPGFEADFWATGQAVSAEAVLKLLKARTAAPQWPELAEFNCSSCHHDLRPSGWSNRSRGTLVWNRPTAFTTGGDDSLLKNALEKSTDVERLLVGSPNKVEKLQAPLDESIAAWERWRTEGTATTPAHLITWLRRDERACENLTWEEAARLFAAVVAIENALRDQGTARSEQAEPILTRLHELLRLPRAPIHVDTPKDYASTEVGKLLQRWFDLYL